MFEVKQYTQEQAQAWNEFIEDHDKEHSSSTVPIWIIMPIDFRMLR